uniref:hypothetical protein n=1 Tax=Streptomyces polyasparticus TaxID=2767826 RepID=UPI001F4836AF|nr:hypothetical protein [Streptomyces polyasparticus]
MTWPLAGRHTDWRAEKPLPSALDPLRSYTLYGWTEGNSWSASGVSFTTAHLAGLKPGEVRYEAGETEGADAEGYRTVSLGEFRAAVCEDR